MPANTISWRATRIWRRGKIPHSEPRSTYAFLPDGWKMFKRATATFDVSRIEYKYLDFRNIKYYGVSVIPQYPPGTEPLYSFNATVYQIYMSMFF